MATKSEHEKVGGGQDSYPAYEPLHPRKPDRSADPEIHEPAAELGALSEREALLAHLFKVSNDGIVLHELLPSPQQGHLIDVNDRMCGMLGYAREEVLKLTLLDILGAEAREAIPQTLRKLRESGRLLFETMLIRKDRQPMPVEVSVDTLEFRRRRMTLTVVRDIAERKRLQDQVNRWKERLEEEVRTQTEELRDTLGRLQEEIARRTLVETELRRRSQMLQQVTLEMLDAEDRERKRLAEILHDDVQQTLAAAKFHLGLLDGRVRSDEDLAETVRQIKQMLKDAIEMCRSLSHELGPAVLSQSGLDDIFEWLAQQMRSKHGLVVHVQTRGPLRPPSEPVRMFLYRAAQEILFNVIKHAEVSEAKLRLTRVRNRLRLTISDRGQGFDLRSLAHTAGFGLLSVRERAELLGGRMKIKSTAGQGSTFLIAVPDAADAEESRH